MPSSDGRSKASRSVSTVLICRRMINGLTTIRYLPKYSPDLNPIEMPYSKFKTFLRKVAARTIPSLNRAIRSFIPQLSPQECANYFRHAGYVSI